MSKENNSIKEINNKENLNIKDSNNSIEEEEAEEDEIDEENDESDDINEDESIENESEENEDETYSLKYKKYSYYEYINSKTENSNYFNKLKKGDYIYGIKQDKFYIILDKNDKSIKMKMIKKLDNGIKNLENNENKITNKKMKNIITISYKECSNYKVHQKIKIKYINYLNIYLELEMTININCSIKDMVEIFSKIYHIPNRSILQLESSLVIIISW